MNARQSNFYAHDFLATNFSFKHFLLVLKPHCSSPIPSFGRQLHPVYQNFGIHFTRHQSNYIPQFFLRSCFSTFLMNSGTLHAMDKSIGTLLALQHLLNIPTSDSIHVFFPLLRTPTPLHNIQLLFFSFSLISSAPHLLLCSEPLSHRPSLPFWSGCNPSVPFPTHFEQTLKEMFLLHAHFILLC